MLGFRESRRTTKDRCSPTLVRVVGGKYREGKTRMSDKQMVTEEQLQEANAHLQMLAEKPGVAAIPGFKPRLEVAYWKNSEVDVSLYDDGGTPSSEGRAALCDMAALLAEQMVTESKPRQINTDSKGGTSVLSLNTMDDLPHFFSALATAAGKSTVGEEQCASQQDDVPVLDDDALETVRADMDTLLRQMYPHLLEGDIESLTPEVVLQPDGRCLFGVRVEASRDNDPKHTKKQALSTTLSSALFAEGLRSCHEAPQLVSRGAALAADAHYQELRKKIEGPMEEAGAEARRENDSLRGAGLPLDALAEYRAGGGIYAQLLEMHAAQTPAYIAFHSVEDMKRALGSLHTVLAAQQERVKGPVQQAELEPLRQQLENSAGMLGCSHAALSVSHPGNQCALHIVTGGDEDNSTTASIQLAENMATTLLRAGIAVQLSDDSAPANATLIFESHAALRKGIAAMTAHKQSFQSAMSRGGCGED